MARLWSSGFELNSITAGVEFTSNTSGTISSAQAHSGTYSWKSSGGGNVANMTFGTSLQYTTVYARAYVYITSYPASSGNTMFLFANGARLVMSTTGTLNLLDSSFNTIGSASSAIPLNSWHYIELFSDSSPPSGSRVITARLDGTQFATSTNRTSSQVTNVDTLTWGFNVAVANTMYFDDIAINDNSGSFQNSWPGAGKIVYLRPNAAGDSTQWTPDSGSNYARVNEVTPDDATSYVSESILNKSDFYTVGASGIGASDTVNLVSVGGRFRNATADATTSFQFQIEKTSAGTVTKSSAIVPNTVTWGTNKAASTAPTNYPITLYQDPDSSNWTQSTVNSMQIGALGGVVGVNAIQLSTIWALVDYTPAAGAPPAMGSTLSMMGVG